MKDFLIKIFKLGNLKKEYIDVLLSHEKEYESYVFTSLGRDRQKNYEEFEFLGDSVINMFVPFYFYRRFPQLRCSDGVKVYNRLKANHVSKTSLSGLARKWGFLPHIKRSSDDKETDVLEDVFEAFFGYTVELLDGKYGVGVGFGIVYGILKTIFDDISEVSLEYDVLYDAKTRLKELFDKHNWVLGSFKNVIYADDENAKKLVIYHYDLGHRTPVIVGQSEGASKGERIRIASERAITHFKNEGYTNDTNNLRLFCESITSKKIT